MIILHISDIAVKEGNGVVTAISKYLEFESKNNKVAVFNLGISIDAHVCLEFNYANYKSISSLPSPFNKPDIVVFNEVYKKKYINLSNECTKNQIKYIIIPHGCLTDLARKKTGSILKKHIAIHFILKSFIENAVAIQFLNEMEKENTHIKYNSYIISGNGIDTNIYKKNICGSKDIIYIGRYDIYHKGIDYIIEICNKYRNWFDKNNIKIYLYGRDSKGNKEIIRKKIEEYSIGNILILGDSVYGKEKEYILKNAYAFLQTSRFEGQPMGILEALNFGVPCIVTKGTTFAEYVNKNKCGLGSEPNIDTIFINIKKIIDDKELRDNMSENAIKCIKRDFDWKVVIDDCVDKYQSLVFKK